MELKDKIDIIAKQIEIIKIKIFLFTSIAAGSWLYAFRLDLKPIGWFLFITFFATIVIIGVNLAKLGTKYEILEKELDND